MSCVDVPVPSSPLSNTARLLEPGQHNGVHLPGGSRPPSKLNALAGEFDPGRINDGVRQQSGGQGRGRGGGGARGGLSSAMNQQGSQSQNPHPTRQPFGDTGAATDSAGGGGGGGGGGANTTSSNGATGGSGGGAARTGATAGGGGAGSGGAGGGGGRSSGAANANHLLNFQYESASTRASGGRGGGRGGARSGGSSRAPGGGGSASGSSSAARGRYGATKPQKYDKNKFLQANFRFLVSDAVDATAYETDADKMFDWDDVLQVEMSTSAPVQCPISLDSPPLCPQITPCGHIFSFPAIMHHLINHGGEQLRRSAPCPLCFAPVVARELRLVRVRRVVQPRAGDQLTLALIRRTRTSIIPQPVDPAAAERAAAAAAVASDGGAAAAAAAAAEPQSLFDRNPFAKFVVGGDASDLWRAAAEQLAACATELVAEGGADAALEAPYVYGALDQLAARARRWAEHRAECLSSRGLLAVKEGAGAAPEALGAAAEAAVKKMFVAAVSDVTAAREAASQRASLDSQFPSLAARPTAATPAAAPPPPLRTGTGAGSTGQIRTTRISSGGGGAAAAATAAGSIAAAAPPAAELVPDTAAGPPSPTGEPQLPFDAVFSEDEADEQPEAAGAAAAPAADAAAPSMDGLGAAHPELLQATVAAGTSPPAAGVDLGRLGGGGGGGPLGGAEVLLGSSPITTQLNTPGTQGEFYTYQAVDGSWVFLHPLNLRCLLHAYGSYDSCPPVITARLLELEDVVQAEAVRKRWRFLSHLPLSGAFRLCEVAMSELVPAEALAPFTDELVAREKRRRRQRADERRQAAAEAAAAARAAAARLGPSAEELQAMPSLSQAVGGGGGGAAAAATATGSALAAAAGAAAAALAREMQLSPSEVAESIALQASLDEAAAAAAAAASPGPPAGGGVSFAHITRMGYAATGPALGSSPPLGSIAAAAAPPPSGAWGARAGPGAAVGGSLSQSGGAAGPGSPWGAAAAAAAAGTGAGPAGPWGGGKGVAVLKAGSAPSVMAGKGGGAAAAATAADGGTADGGGSAKKGKSSKGMLLFSTANQRKY